MGGGGLLGAALLAGLMTAAGGGDVTASVGAALDDAAGRSVTEADRARGQREAKRGHEAEAWRRLGLRRLRRAARRELRCGAQSSGQVRRFFVRHPCRELDQMISLVADPHGNLVVVSVVWVRLTSSSDAHRFEALEDTYGSGD